MRKLGTLPLVVFAVLVINLSLRAQQTNVGSITGSAEDPSGAIVPGAEVVAVKSATGVARSTITTSGGIYSINLLPVGMYTVTVTKQGFHKEIRTNIAAIAGRTESRRPKAERLGRSVGEAHQTAGVAFRQRSRLSAVFGRPSGTVGKTAPSGHRKAFEVK